MHQDIEDVLKERLSAVEARIQAACARSGRRREEVTLVCVTKSVTSDVAALLPKLGYPNLGESRPQELWRKAAALHGEVCWHLIGHLQRNKIERTLPMIGWIHSVDRWPVLEALEAEAGRIGQTIRVFLEVNASGEVQKQGFDAQELILAKDRLAPLRNVHIQGLMTMAALAEDPEAARPTFVALRETRNRLAECLTEPHHLHHLSMGMTHDFEIALEEGATMIRVGTALFAGLPGEKT
jgi:pyridoxal phosphate enzyme (YggS family)